MHPNLWNSSVLRQEDGNKAHGLPWEWHIMNPRRKLPAQGRKGFIHPTTHPPPPCVPGACRTHFSGRVSAVPACWEHPGRFPCSPAGLRLQQAPPPEPAGREGEAESWSQQLRALPHLARTGTSISRSRSPRAASRARHGEPEQQPEEKSHGAPLQG